MKALTVYQPWASLIMAGAKPYEFRRWDYASREPGLVGERIVIHAGARPMRLDEIEDLLDRIAEGESSLDSAIATPIVERCREALVVAGAAKKMRRRARPAGPALFDLPPEDQSPPPSGQILPLASGLGTAVLGRARKASVLFRGAIDSDRIDHAVWAWPLTDIRSFDHPVPARGAQGFWTWPEKLEAA